MTNFSHGHHGDAEDADNPRVRWRYDPAMAAISGQFADCGIHALHMASFLCDDQVETLLTLPLLSQVVNLRMMPWLISA